MALTWTSTAQHAVDHGIKLCVFGRAGSGKTTLIKTAPRPIIASAEAGTLSIADSNITMAEIRNYADLLDFYRWAKECAVRQGYETICLDSISEIAERLLSDEKARTKDPRKAYGEMGDQLSIMIRNFRDLPGLNVYFTAKAEIRETPEGGKLWGAALPGAKNAQGLSYYFDEFLYAGVAEAPAAKIGDPPLKYHFLRTRLDSQHDCKDRSGFLDEIEPPNLQHIFTKIRNGLASRLAPVATA